MDWINRVGSRVTSEREKYREKHEAFAELRLQANALAASLRTTLQGLEAAFPSTLIFLEEQETPAVLGRNPPLWATSTIYLALPKREMVSSYSGLQVSCSAFPNGHQNVFIYGQEFGTGHRPDVLTCNRIMQLFPSVETHYRRYTNDMEERVLQSIADAIGALIASGEVISLQGNPR